MSETLEKTIKQLRSSNIELEKDIEEKSRTDEMRKQFIRNRWKKRNRNKL